MSFRIEQTPELRQAVGPERCAALLLEALQEGLRRELARVPLDHHARVTVYVEHRSDDQGEAASPPGSS